MITCLYCGSENNIPPNDNYYALVTIQCCNCLKHFYNPLVKFGIIKGEEKEALALAKMILKLLREFDNHA